MMRHMELNNDLRFLAQSEIRIKILNELNNHPTSARGIVKKTNINYSTVTSNMNKLENRDYIRKVKNKYYITPMTEIYLKTLMEFKKSVELIKDYGEFWGKHNIDQLTIESIRNINDLKDSKLIETTPVDIYKTHNTIRKQLMEADNVKAIFPYLHPDYPSIIEEILRNGGNVELIIPHTILKAIITRIDKNIKNKAVREKKLKIYSSDNNLDLYLTICDETMSLGLFKNDGSFDQNRILISNNQKSQNWAEELFQKVKDGVIR